MAETIAGQLDGSGLRVALVQARFNTLVADRLRDGAVDTLVRHGVAAGDITTVLVPGAFELAPVARRLATAGACDAVVCLGAVVRGDTPHFDHVCQAAARGIAEVALEAPVAVTFGVVTADTVEQALDRAGGKAGNKGAEAALAAVELAHVYRQLPGSAGSTRPSDR